MKDKRNKLDTDFVTEEAQVKKPTAEAVSYTDWFSAALRSHKKLKPSHYETIKAFFKNQKLTEHETKETFDTMLKVFGF
jgi:hypothetical protein